MTRLFLGNLSYRLTEDSLGDALAATGVRFERLKIIHDRETQRPRGFAFVEVEDPAAATEVWNGMTLDGRDLRVAPANDRPRGNGGNGNGHGHGGHDRPRHFAPPAQAPAPPAPAPAQRRNKGSRRRRDDDVWQD